MSWDVMSLLQLMIDEGKKMANFSENYIEKLREIREIGIKAVIDEKI
jgi:hypothetical protein